MKIAVYKNSRESYMTEVELNPFQDLGRKFPWQSQMSKHSPIPTTDTFCFLNFKKYLYKYIHMQATCIAHLIHFNITNIM
jgi:hypothetical protein